jgi:hypothetical protein
LLAKSITIHRWPFPLGALSPIQPCNENAKI